MTYRQQISAVKVILSACLQRSCLNNTEHLILNVTHKTMCTSSNPLIFHSCAPWTSHQLIIGLKCRTANHSLTPKARLETPGHLSLKWMSLICRGNLERPHSALERTYTFHATFFLLTKTLFQIRNALNLWKVGRLHGSVACQNRFFSHTALVLCYWPNRVKKLWFERFQLAIDFFKKRQAGKGRTKNIFIYCFWIHSLINR